MLRALALTSVMILGPALHATAATIELNFTVAGFHSAPGNVVIPAPTDPVSGQVVYEVDDLTWLMTDLISLDLTTIDGHTYALSEVGFDPGGFGLFAIGGTLNGIGTNAVGSDDFIFAWDSNTGAPAHLFYTSSSTSHPDSPWDNNSTYWIWEQSACGSPSCVSFSYTELETDPPPVPEPSMLLLVGSSLAAAYIRARRRIGGRPS